MDRIEQPSRVRTTRVVLGGSAGPAGDHDYNHGRAATSTVYGGQTRVVRLDCKKDPSWLRLRRAGSFVANQGRYVAATTRAHRRLPRAAVGGYRRRWAQRQTVTR
jgi:hypothetical protein